MKENKLYSGDEIYYSPSADDGRRGFITPENPMLTNKNIDYHGGVTGYNPIKDDDDDGLGVDLETEIKWLRNVLCTVFLALKDLIVQNNFFLNTANTYQSFTRQ